MDAKIYCAMSHFVLQTDKVLIPNIFKIYRGLFHMTDVSAWFVIHTVHTNRHVLHIHIDYAA